MRRRWLRRANWRRRGRGRRSRRSRQAPPRGRAGGSAGRPAAHAALEAVDYHGVARVLAQATKKGGYDLILAGDRTEEESQGAVGPAVAEMLGVPHLTAAIDVDLEGEGALRVTRRDMGVLRTL